MPSEDKQCPAEANMAETGQEGGPAPIDDEPDAGPDIFEDGAAISEKRHLISLTERLTAEIADLRAEFAAKIRYDEVKERQIASMHEELQDLRAGLHLRLLQPLFTDLISMYDDLCGVEASGTAAPELASFKDDVLETLARNGVSKFSVDSHEVDRARQRVIRTAPTSDEKLDRTIRGRLRAGFEYEAGKVLRPEWVVAYRYAPNAEEPDAAPTTRGEPGNE
ncbi:hypothetical protein GCM10022254_32550 [Actinomadura meridiana]|uniref:Nucleotide exchange factor GrpE n=1 Tax=Actinomadura meridiana TaxID=559626 RepID=A0ABP8C2L1_9ACTN